MFYSGWRFPTPQRLESHGNQAQSGCLVQTTEEPGVSLVQFHAPRDGQQPARARGHDGRAHVRSDVPIHPNSGVFYFEVQLCSTSSGGGEEGEGGVGGADPGVVIGVCRKSLPPAGLPGEETNGVGFFISQRMVYSNGKHEGEVVRFRPSANVQGGAANDSDNANCDGAASRGNSAGANEEQEGRRFKGLRMYDTVGCIVNLLDGTVRFTFNGEVLDFTATLNRRVPKLGYYAAVGVLRRAAPVRLRVMFPHARRQTPIPRPTLASAATAVGENKNVKITQEGGGPAASGAASEQRYFNFDIDKYCEGVVRKVVLTRLLGTSREAAVGSGAGECACRDASIVETIRKHMAARGMTKALTAFEKEQQEIMCPNCGRGGGSTNNTGENIQGRVDPTEEIVQREGHTNRDAKSCVGGTSVELDSQIIAYSAYIRGVREDVACGRMHSATERILGTSVVSPAVLDKLKGCVERLDTLPSDFWGLLFFTQRRDVLFLLRVAYLVELTLGMMERRLQDFLSWVGREEGCAQRGAQAPAASQSVTEPVLRTAAELMEFAYRSLLEPMRSVAAAVEQHRASVSTGSLTGESAAFCSYGTDCEERNESLEDRAACLFAGGRECPWSDPKAPVTLLVRCSVSSVPAPKGRQQRGVVQKLATLISHVRAVCARAERHHRREDSYEWVEEWLALVADTRQACRSRCTTLLLHAIEDFNGALEYRLLAWERRREHRTKDTSSGSPSGRRGDSDVPPKVSGQEGADNSSVVGGHLFPTLRSMWRHVHAKAALEPLLLVVTKAFSDQLNRVVTSARMMTQSISSRGPDSTFCKGPKRGILHSSGSSGSDINGKVAEESGTHTSPRESQTPLRTAPAENARECASNRNEGSKRASRYSDDLRMSFLYMKNVYNAVFA